METPAPKVYKKCLHVREWCDAAHPPSAEWRSAPKVELRPRRWREPGSFYSSSRPLCKLGVAEWRIKSARCRVEKCPL